MPDRTADIAAKILAEGSLKLEGISTHFANSSWDVVGTEDQIRLFDQALAQCHAAGIDFPMVHLANSAGAMRYPVARRQMVRMGVACYGIDPYNLFEGKERPVLTWKARVMVIRDLPPNSSVSYARTYRTKTFERIATLGVGYGDGYPRNLSNKGYVMLAGVKAPIVGLICMDQILVDVSHLPQVKPGDVATLAGDSVRVPDLARMAETNPHEITCRIMPRVPRHYLYPSAT
jgi:alanine racemase